MQQNENVPMINKAGYSLQAVIATVVSSLRRKCFFYILLHYSVDSGYDVTMTARRCYQWSLLS